MNRHPGQRSTWWRGRVPLPIFLARGSLHTAQFNLHFNELLSNSILLCPETLLLSLIGVGGGRLQPFSDSCRVSRVGGSYKDHRDDPVNRAAPFTYEDMVAIDEKVATMPGWDQTKKSHRRARGARSFAKAPMEVRIFFHKMLSVHISLPFEVSLCKSHHVWGRCGRSRA